VQRNFYRYQIFP